MKLPTLTVTPLGYALMWLIRNKPGTGYALRRVFETTPLGNYSSSPGSIYPALRGLERAALIESRDEGGKDIFYITPAGGKALEDWLSVPVSQDELDHGTGILLLRFALLQDGPRSRTLNFLASLKSAANVRAQGLRDFYDGVAGQGMPLQARLALLHGIRSVETTAHWAADARDLLEADERQQVFGKETIR